MKAIFTVSVRKHLDKVGRQGADLFDYLSPSTSMIRSLIYFNVVCLFNNQVMHDLGLRDMFRESFEQLQLRLYQLDRLIEVQLADLWHHFVECGVESHMYASQWFLTLFTAKFPLFLVSLDLIEIKLTVVCYFSIEKCFRY